MMILTLMIILSVLVPMIDAYWTLKIFLVATGIVLVGMKVCIYSTAAIISKEENEQAGFLSLLESMWMLAGMIGMWIMAYYIEISPDTWLRFLYIYAVIASINLFIWKIVTVDETALDKEKSTPVLTQIQEMLSMCKSSLVLAAIVMIFICSVLEMSFGAWLPGFYEAALNLSPSLSLKVASIGGLATFAGRFMTFFLLKKMQWQRMLLCYYTVGLVFLCIVLFSLHKSGHTITNMSDVSLMALIFPVFGFFFAPSTPVLNSSILSRTPKEKQALLMTIIAIVFALASSLTARGVGYLMQHFGGIEGFKIATIVPLILLIVLVIPYAKLLKSKKV